MPEATAAEAADLHTELVKLYGSDHGPQDPATTLHVLNAWSEGNLARAAQLASHRKLKARSQGGTRPS